MHMRGSAWMPQGKRGESAEAIVGARRHVATEGPNPGSVQS